jgi:hypothetical protein
MIQSSFDQIGLRLGELIQWLFLGHPLITPTILAANQRLERWFVTTYKEIHG